MINTAKMPEPQELVLTIERTITGTENAVDNLMERVDRLAHLLSPLRRPRQESSSPVVMSVEPPRIKTETEAPLVAKLLSINDTAEEVLGDVCRLIDELTY